MSKIQNFSLHTHNNALGVFDGVNTPLEMFQKAESLGWDEIGVTNHFIWHPHMPLSHRMFFDDYQEALNVHQQALDLLKEAIDKVNIKVRIGYEVDYFPSAKWCDGFEKMMEILKPEYLIGSTHFIRNAEETFLCNIFHLRNLPASTTKEQMREYLKNYWLNIISSIESGYFNFIAHLDYCAVFDLCMEPEWDEYKWMVIEALAKHNMPYEINTGGYTRLQTPHPHPWMIAELCKRDVPVILSDDAHNVDVLGRYFSEAEQLLKSFGCTNRWRLK